MALRGQVLLENCTKINFNKMHGLFLKICLLILIAFIIARVFESTQMDGKIVAVLPIFRKLPEVAAASDRARCAFTCRLLVVQV